MNNQQADKTRKSVRRHILIKAGAALSVIALIVLIIVTNLQADKQNESMRGFQNLETAARQILTTMEAYNSEHKRYPANKMVFDSLIKEYDSVMASSYEPIDSGKGFSLTLWRKDRSDFRYLCRQDHSCHWKPHLPYP